MFTFSFIYGRLHALSGLIFFEVDLSGQMYVFFAVSIISFMDFDYVQGTTISIPCCIPSYAILYGLS